MNTTETETTTQPNPGSKTRPKSQTTKPKGRPRKLLTPEQIQEEEQTLLERYQHLIPNTLTNATKGNPVEGLTPAEVTKYEHKRSVLIKCNDCDNQRRIATSDLAQVKLCEDCTRNARNARKRQRRADAKADANKEQEPCD